MEKCPTIVSYPYPRRMGDYKHTRPFCPTDPNKGADPLTSDSPTNTTCRAVVELQTQFNVQQFLSKEMNLCEFIFVLTKNTVKKNTLTNIFYDLAIIQQDDAIFSMAY